MKQWSPVVHQVYRVLKERLAGVSIQGETWVVMFSGGVDSVSLLEVLLQIQSSLGIELCLFHLHHGPASEVQKNYRDQALKFSQDTAQQRGVPFYSAQSQILLSSESEMREFRRQQIEILRRSVKFERVVFGHQQDDFLETQLMRLIRGAGPEAGLVPMKFRQGSELRPLLDVSREKLRKLAEAYGWRWLEDPSNQDPQFMRNWLRNIWLPMLEDKYPGALGSLSGSLQLLSDLWQDARSESLPSDIWVGEQISRPLFLTLTVAQQGQCLAQYIRKQGIREFSHNQIKEILKHLDISRIEHKFEAAQMTWTLSRDFIAARPALRTTGPI